MLSKIKTDNPAKFFLIVIGIIIIGLALRELSHIFIPFTIAYFLFFFFAPLNHLLEKARIPKFLIILLDIFITGTIIYFAFNFIVSSFMDFSEQAPLYADKLSRIVRSAAIELGIRDPYFRYFSIERVIQKLDYKLLAGGIFSSTLSLLGSVLFVIFFFVFVVVGHDTIYEAIRKRFISTVSHNNAGEQQVIIVNEEHKELVLADMIKSITEQIQRYIIAKVVINFAAGVLVFILLTILDVDFPLIWGLFTFLFNFVPTIGSAAALILPVLMALIQYESASFALLTASLMGLIQTIAFNVAEPSIIGKRLNLNPLLILFSVLIWGYIWGIVGMLMAVPLTAVIKIIISNSENHNMKFLSDLMSQE
jgi:predicted PurR-regulated permease PerM